MLSKNDSQFAGGRKKLIAFSSKDTNNIRVVDADTMQNYSSFKGVQLRNSGMSIEVSSNYSQTLGLPEYLKAVIIGHM